MLTEMVLCLRKQELSHPRTKRRNLARRPIDDVNFNAKRASFANEKCYKLKNRYLYRNLYS